MGVMTRDMMERDVTSPITTIFHTWPKIMESFAEYLEEDRRTCKDIIKTLDAGEKISAIFITLHFGYVCTEILNHYKVPIIAISPPGLAPHFAGVFGNPDNPAYSPDLFMPVVAPLSFSERLASTLLYGLLDGRINPFLFIGMEWAGMDLLTWDFRQDIDI